MRLHAGVNHHWLGNNAGDANVHPATHPAKQQRGLGSNRRGSSSHVCGSLAAADHQHALALGQQRSVGKVATREQGALEGLHVLWRS